MKVLLKILFLLTSFNGFSQETFEIYFKDNCNDSIISMKFYAEVLGKNFEYESVKSQIELDNSESYFIYTGYEIDNNLFQSFYFNHEFTSKIDTLSLPKIRFTAESTLHSQFWGYYNCNEICNGKEVDCWDNGEKRIEGNFQNGKPDYIFYFNEDGIKEKEEYWNSGVLELNLVKEYDDKGALLTYSKYKYKKRKTIVKTFNQKGKLIEKEVSKSKRSIEN